MFELLVLSESHKESGLALVQEEILSLVGWGLGIIVFTNDFQMRKSAHFNNNDSRQNYHLYECIDRAYRHLADKN